MALRHLVPFVALDQIRGGAKVLNLLARTEWPFVYEAGTVSLARVASDARALLSGDLHEALFDARTRTIRNANRTLARLSELVRDLPSR